VLLGIWLGFLADRRFGTEPAFILVGAALGMVAAALGFWSTIKDKL
jgi:F0F1-type ATP synthase assembly protein I